jgi:streptogramin lyase
MRLWTMHVLLLLTVGVVSARANVRQILGRPGELWAAESGTEPLVVVEQ